MLSKYSIKKYHVNRLIKIWIEKIIVHYIFHTSVIYILSVVYYKQWSNIMVICMISTLFICKENCNLEPTRPQTRVLILRVKIYTNINNIIYYNTILFCSRINLTNQLVHCEENEKTKLERLKYSYIYI